MTFEPIPGHPGYMVSREGQVRGTRGVLKPWRASKQGHLCVGLAGRQRALVHRLVLLTFVGPCPAGMEACHNNGNASDNRLSNLRWDTRSANRQDAKLHGTFPEGVNHANTHLTLADVAAIRHMSGLQREIGQQFGITQQSVSKIKTGVRHAISL